MYVQLIKSFSGVWLMHCHFERHAKWGMEMTFIVRNGKRSKEKILSRPSGRHATIP